MISKNEIKWIRQLHDKKYRHEEGLYLAEGSRLVLDLMQTKPEDVVLVTGTSLWASKHATKLREFSEQFKEIGADDLGRIASLKSTDEVLGVFRFPVFNEIILQDMPVSLYLDEVRDPGNLGTIIRTADWFGVKEIFLAPGSTDTYNSKTIQASMSSIARVKVSEVDINFLKEFVGFGTLIGTAMNGKPYTQLQLKKPAIICLGNESHGLSKDIFELCQEVVTIPSKSLGSESLNVAVSAGIILSHFCI
ncbi:MAG: RNA methyltransferase [Saprospiraceae bacterium]|nr:RNA methyltransferase [Candidatus Vicinibacter affinis]MBP6172576.1 RNA methyltransferase [Saprospiraceae bacterium]MBK7304008.1 RNA methyltransferase [Candidatus Vicinibacter affinis]MBK7694211.1 RNA methyltransferase [Candidatus Vicinibacter affinis]MBK7799005.1 RNA methyltransferase [Candidatus Vicinibacter affinis]